MSNNPESFVTTEIKEVVESIVKEKKITDYNMLSLTGTTLGDNYLGEIINVIVKGKNEKGRDQELNFILKCAPRSDIFREKINVRKIYIREIYVYENLFKEFLNIQIENGITKLFYPFATCHKTIILDKLETLIMQNMKTLGFALQDRKKPLNYDHVVFVMKSYGKLHALSFAIKDQHPELFRELADNLQENFIRYIPQEHAIKATEEVYNFLDGPLKEKFGKFRFKIHDILLHELSEAAAGKYAVIGHGDSWTNNILYKYGDEASPEKPTELIFLDWQLCRVSSPVVDLSYFVFVCTDKKLRDKYYRHIMNEYYNSLASFLRELGSDPDVLYPHEVFEEHLTKFLGLGIYMSVSVLKLMLYETEEVPDFKNMVEEDFKNVNFKNEFKAKSKYEERIKEVLEDCKEYGYIELNN